MQCSAPPPLTDDQISAAIDDAADPTVRAHLAECHWCAARLVKARQMEHSLRARLRRWDCPTPQQLAEYHIRRVDAETARSIEEHLRGCASCRSELADLQEFMAADAPLAAPPPTPMPPARAPWGALFARPPAAASASALRGAGAGPIMAEADGTTVFLDVQPAGADQVALNGQLVDADQARWAGALVEIRQSGVLLATAEVDDLGGFACGPLPAGMIELRIAPRHGRMIVLNENAVVGNQ